MSDAPLPPSATPPEAPAPATAAAPAPVPAAPAPTPVGQEELADVAPVAAKPLLNPLQQNGPPPSSTIVEPPRSPMPVDPASSVASPSVVAPSAAPASTGAGGSDTARMEGTATPAPAFPASEDKPPLPTDAPVPPSPQPPKDEEPPTLPTGAIPSAVPTPTVILTEEQSLASGSAHQSQPQPPVSPAPPPPATPATPSVPPAAVQAPSEPVPVPSATAFPAADANAMDVDADGDADAQGEEDDGLVQPADSGNLKRAGDELSGREEKRAKEEPQAGSSAASAPTPMAPAPVYIPGTPHPEYAPAKYDENLPTSALTQAQHKHLLATVRSLKKNPFAFAFLAPVDPVMLNIPHYPTVVKNPMDLGTVETKLIVSDPRGPPKDKSKAKNWDESKGRYGNVLEVARDVRQIWENTRMFNGPNHDVSLNANKLDAIFEKGLKSLPTDRPAPMAGSPAGQPSPRRPSFAGAPAIRRSLDGTEQRPKREIHPPPNKDVGYEPTRKPKRRNDPQLAWVAKQFRTLENKQYEAITSPFWYPVDQLIATIPLYSEIIKQPIDLNIIRQRFNDSYYENVDSALADVQLVWDNAMKYNRPGDAFHNAATDCMRLWNDKMKAMPPKELPRQESEDPLAEDFDDSEGEDSATIKELEDKIEAMQKQIEAIRAKRAAKRNGAKQKSKGGAAARRQSVSKAGGSAATNGNAGGAAYGQPQAKRPRKNKDAPAYGGADDEDSDSSNITYLTLAQKQRLASAMDSADAETIAAAMQLIKSAMDITDDEIEVDLEQVPLSCAIKLYKLVVLRKGPRAPRGSKKNAAAAGRKGPGGTRKRMNEQEEADRIRRMEEQLQSFDAGARGSYGGPAAHAYDDSDESSDEGESDDE